MFVWLIACNRGTNRLLSLATLLGVLILLSNYQTAPSKLTPVGSTGVLKNVYRVYAL